MTSPATLPPLYLVTGATGFIASHVISQLLQSPTPVRVRATVRSLSTLNVDYLISLAATLGRDLSFAECSLTSREGWEAAVQDCVGVYHLASPNPPGGDVMNEDLLIGPATQGVLCVLEACAKTPSVRRVVLTSSVVAVTSTRRSPGVTQSVFSEADWTNLAVAGSYEKSKTIAERQAWDFMAAETRHFDLVAILPSYVQGPVLTTEHGKSALSTEVVRRLLLRSDPICAHMPLNICDVRDVALAHLRAMAVAHANGRYIICAGFIWHDDVAKKLAEEYNPRGYNVPTSVAPYGLLWVLGFFDGTIRSILPTIGHYHTYDTSRANTDLSLSFTPPVASLLAMAQSLVDVGAVPKPPVKVKRWCS